VSYLWVVWGFYPATVLAFSPAKALWFAPRQELGCCLFPAAAVAAKAAEGWLA
jgi:hypothetical protein